MCGESGPTWTLKGSAHHLGVLVGAANQSHLIVASIQRWLEVLLHCQQRIVLRGLPAPGDALDAIYPDCQCGAAAGDNPGTRPFEILCYA